MYEVFFLMVGAVLSLFVLGIGVAVAFAVAMRPLARAAAEIEATANSAGLSARSEFSLEAANDQYFDQGDRQEDSDMAPQAPAGSPTSLSSDAIRALYAPAGGLLEVSKGPVSVPTARRHPAQNPKCHFCEKMKKKFFGSKPPRDE